MVEAIVRCRKEKGRYADFYDFLSKVDAVACNKKTVESLIKAGAFDSLGHTRKGLLAVHAEAIDAYADVKRNEAAGQFDLFGAFGDDRDGGSAATVAMPTIGDSEWDKRDKLAFEREMLGLYVSDHPLAGLEHAARTTSADTTIAALTEEGSVPDGQIVTARRHPHRRAAPGHQAGPGLGVGHAGGPGRRGRGAVLPEHVRGDRRSTSPRTPS